jgi:lysozyme
MDVKALIEDHEKRMKKAYRCSAGKTTIGVGRNLDDVGLSDDEIDYLYENDIKRVNQALAQYPWVAGLSEVRRAACQDLMFNLGPTRFAGFVKFIQAMGAGRYESAAAELKDSRWYGQVGRRGPRICSMILNNRWPE